MKEYTILSVISVIATVFLDKSSGVRILRRKEFFIFILVIFAMKLLVNGYLTRKQVFMYNPGSIIGLRLGSIPVEDFLFGFSMVTMTVIFWEYFKRKGL